MEVDRFTPNFGTRGFLWVSVHDFAFEFSKFKTANLIWRKILAVFRVSDHDYGVNQLRQLIFKNPATILDFNRHF